MPICAMVVGAGNGTGAEVAKLLAGEGYGEGYAVVLARRDSASLAPPVAEIEQSGFLVGREAARRMLPRRSGSILFVGATASVKSFKEPW